MNDSFRGAVIVVALVSLYLGLRLAWSFLRHWRSASRRHITEHVFYLVLALILTAVLNIDRTVDASGENAPVTWQEVVLLVKMSAIVAGLRALCVHQSRRKGATDARRTEATP